MQLPVAAPVVRPANSLAVALLLGSAALVGLVCLTKGESFAPSAPGAAVLPVFPLLEEAAALQVPPTPMGSAAMLARAPPPRMADAAAKKAPKKAAKEKVPNPSPFKNQAGDADMSIFERPRDFEDVKQWDNYAGGAAISPTRNFEGPSWERAYAKWAEDGIPRPSETQKLGFTPNLSQPKNKAYVDYQSRRKDYSDGPQYRGKPKVTANYKKMDVEKFKDLPPPVPASGATGDETWVNRRVKR